MTDRHNHQSAEIIRAFLDAPRVRWNFERFFELCWSESLPYLRRLRSAGWRLPEDQVQQENALNDIACDVLGPFLAGGQNRPCFVLFDFIERHQLVPTEVDPDALLKHFRILLRGFIRKELTLLRGLMNPQIKNLKRRLKDILAGSEYGSSAWPGERGDSVFLARNATDLRNNQPSIERHALDQIVREAYCSSRSRTEWCATVLELLDKETEVRNAVPISLLIGAVVAVNAEVADASGLVAGHVPTPTEDYLQKRIAAAVEETLDWLQSSCLPRYVNRGRVTDEEAVIVMKACRAYLEDLALNGEADKIPRYFMALMPGLSQADYQSRYKYVMDTIASRGLKELRNRLRQDPTIWPFGGYVPDEE